MKLALAILLFAIPLQAEDRVFHVAHYVYPLAVGVDLGVSWAKLAERPDLKEANPLLGQTKTQQIAVTAGTLALTEWGVHTLVKQGHSRIAAVLLWTGIGLRSFVIVHNLRK